MSHTMFQPGMRGGLARVRPPSTTAVSASTLVGRTPVDGDEFVQARSQWKLVSRTMVFAGFMLYIFVITTYRFNVGDVAVGIALAGLLFQREGIRFGGPLTGFVMLYAWCAVGYFQTEYRGPVYEELINMGKLALILLAMINALRTRSQVRAFIVFWVACFGLFPLRGAYFTYFVGGYTVDGRAVWNYIYRNPNDLAALTLLMVGLCAGVLVSDVNKWVRRAAVLGLVTLSLLVFMTQSRGAFLGLAGFGVLALAGYKHRIRALAFTAVAGVVIALAAPKDVWERLGNMTKATETENLGELDDKGSGEQRLAIWKTAVRITADHPAFGVGWGAYPNANEDYAPRSGALDTRQGARDAHNTYLRTVAEIGFPGLGLFLGLISWTLTYAGRVRRRCKEIMPTASQQLLFAQYGLVAFLTAGIFGSFSRLAFLYVYITLIWLLARVCEDDLAALKREGHLERGSSAAPRPAYR